MPAMLEDPSTRTPPPQAHTQAAPSLPPRHATLPKLSSAALTLYPVTNGSSSIPQDLVKFLHAEFSAEIERGTTYPMEQPMNLQQFAEYWFGTFAVLAILDDEDASAGDGLREGRKWEKVCLGTFYIKPNYPGSSISHKPFISLLRQRINVLSRPMLPCLQCRLCHYHRGARQRRRTGHGRSVSGICAEIGMFARCFLALYCCLAVVCC